MPFLGDDSVSVEGLTKVLFVVPVILFLSPVRVEAVKSNSVRIAYFNKIFGHLRRHPYGNSSTLTVLDCNTPVAIMEKKGKKRDEQWYPVEVGVYEGHVKKSHISFGKGECFQKKYSHFFGAMKIEPSEQYHWGKLYDRYEQAKTKVP